MGDTDGGDEATDTISSSSAMAPPPVSSPLPQTGADVAKLPSGLLAPMIRALVTAALEGSVKVSHAHLPEHQRHTGTP